MFKKIRARLFLIGGLVFLWWWLSRPKQEPDNQINPIEIPVVPDQQQPSVEEPASSELIEKIPETIKPVTRKRRVKAEVIPDDDLTTISGIGPKIASVLKAAGITRFTQLAEADSTRLWQILQEAGIRLAKPETWIAQAKKHHKA